MKSTAPKKGINKRKYIVTYVVVVIAILTCTSMALKYTLSHVVALSRSCAKNLGEYAVREDAHTLQEFMHNGIFFLESASHVVERMIDAGADNNLIQNFLESESDIAAKNTNGLSGDAFGYINGTFLHSDSNDLGEGYIPMRRPWYKDAVNAHGRVVIGKPFTSAKNSEETREEMLVTLSKSLHDKKGVIAFSFPQTNIKKFINARNENDRGIWMVMDELGEEENIIVASSEETLVGFNCYSPEAMGLDEEKLARKIRLENGTPFEIEFKGTHYMAFSSEVLDNWRFVHLWEYSDFFAEATNIKIRGICAMVACLALLVFFATLAFVRKMRLAKFVTKKSEFLQDIAGELLTPLNGILGMTHVLLREVRDENQRHFVKDIQMAATKLSSTVSDMKDIAKIESEGLVLEPVQYDLFSLLKDCFDKISPKATAKNLHFSLECNPDIPSTLWGDEERIRQIIVNLLAISIVHTETGEVRLSIGFDTFTGLDENRIDETINLKITVRDSGLGNRDENQDLFLGLFDLFGSQKEKGSRYSIELTKQMIAACNGEIMVKSRFGEGTTYMVSIPQLVLNRESVGDFASRYKKTALKERSGTEKLFAPSARILVVDDAELNLRVICGLLKETRIQIDTALNGAQCLEMVRTRHYDLILLDNLMPNMDGRETYERMKKLTDNKNQDTPVLILVAGAESIDKESFTSAGFMDFIPKPLMESDLIRVLKWYLPKQLILTHEDMVVQNKEGSLSGESAVKRTIPSGDGFHQFEVQKKKSLKKVREIVDDQELDMVATLKPEEKLAAFQDFLNVSKGLEFCMKDDGFYREMLEEYAKSDMSKDLSQAFEKADWSEYQILIHSMKSTSETIGAEDLAKEAKDLEESCKKGYVGFIRQHHARVLNMYIGLIQNIKKGLEE